MSNRVRSMTRVLVLGLGLAACQAVPDPRTAPIEALAPKVLPRAPSAPRIDAPELARLGQYAIGTTLDTFVLPACVALTTDGVSAEKLETAERTLPARVWYPARAAAGARPTSYAHTYRWPGSAGSPAANAGNCIRGSATR